MNCDWGCYAMSKYPKQSLERNSSSPAMRSAPPPLDQLRPATWDPVKFNDKFFGIPVTRYKVTGVTTHEKCQLHFAQDLLRFSIKGKTGEPTLIDYLSIRHIDYQEVQRKDRKPEGGERSRHVSENEAECFGGPAWNIPVVENEQLIELRHGDAFKLDVVYLSAKLEDVSLMKMLISNLGSKDSFCQYATKVRYDRWVKKAFFEVTNSYDVENTLSFRDFKTIVTDHMNINQPDKYKDWYNEFSSQGPGMSIDQLQTFFHALMFDSAFLANVILNGFEYSKQGLTVDQFKQFHTKIQKQEVSTEKRQFVMEKRVLGKKFSKKDKVSLQNFYTYLFSRENDIFNTKKKDSLSYPLNYYWLNSSHNTYLMGHQLNGESSVEAYIRVLLQGCRCIELDCINGPNNDPIVWHQNTLCTKIKLVDVLKAINRFAFVRTPYPLILSIENHLSIEQQIIMANMMKAIFKKKLVVYDLFPHDTKLPSPEALRNKILVKNKKIRDTTDNVEEDEVDENDEELQNSVYGTAQTIDDTFGDTKKFEVWINDSVEGEIYSYCQVAIQGCYLYLKEDRDRTSLRSEMRQHRCNCWYFGGITRRAAEGIMTEFIRNRYLANGRDQATGTGSFLVRRSVSLQTGLYNIVVSIWLNNDIKHMKVKMDVFEDRLSTTQFYIDPDVKFSSVGDFIDYYHTSSIPQSAYFKYPIPNPDFYKKKLWYKGRIDRVETEAMLMIPPLSSGKFLIRDKYVQERRIGFVISFLVEIPTPVGTSRFVAQHAIAKEDGPYVLIKEDVKFWSLNELVHHFTQYPISEAHGVRLGTFCKDRPYHKLRQVEMKTIEMNEDYPYEEGGVRLSLLKGFKLHNAVKEIVSNSYTADLGMRKGLNIPIHLVSVIKDQTPFGDQAKHKILLTRQTPDIAHQVQFFFKFRTPISKVTLRFQRNQELLQFCELFSKAASLNKNEQSVCNGLSKELSDLVVYCQAVKVPKPFALIEIEEMEPYQMCSFTELTVDKFLKDRYQYMNMLMFTNAQLARMYPKWSRTDSSNYSPMAPWSLGVQMVALNFQTPDLSMQLNHGMFTRNLNTGYIAKPNFMAKENYDPADIKSYVSAAGAIKLNVKILIGRLITLPKHWNKSGCYVGVTLHGVDGNSSSKTVTDKRPGLSPKWYDSPSSNMEFKVGFKQLALLQFSLYSSGSNELLAQRCVPVDYIREGYRSVILHNLYGEELELGSLLVHISISPWEMYDRCDIQDMNTHRLKDLTKKANDLAAVIYSGIKRGTVMEAQLIEEQATLDGLLKEIFEMKYPVDFQDMLERPSLTAPLPFTTGSRSCYLG